MHRGGGGAYNDDDLDRIYDDNYYLDRNLSGKYKWHVIAEFIHRQFKPDRVLEVGCATGMLVSQMCKLGIDAYGIDGSTYGLSRAADNISKRLSHVNLNSTKFPFPDNHFDLICSLHTIEHVHNIDFMTGELKRVLRPGGTIWMVTPDLPPESWTERHVNCKKYKAWKEVFENAGFKVTRKKYYEFIDLRGRLAPLRLYHLPEPILTWCKYLVYWCGANIMKLSKNKEASFTLKFD